MPAFYCLRCKRKIRSSSTAHQLKDGTWCGGIEPEPREPMPPMNSYPKPAKVVKPLRADGKRECAVCTNSYKALSGPDPVIAHFDYATHRWCPGGKAPTAAQKAGRRMRGKSVRTISGGLPEHGKR